MFKTLIISDGLHGNGFGIIRGNLIILIQNVSLEMMS